MLAPAAYLAWALAGLASVVSTWAVRGLALRTGWLDLPNPLVASHTRAVARPGGVGIALSATGVCAYFAFMSPSRWSMSLAIPPLVPLLVPTLLFLLLGLADDRFRLGAGQKLSLQTVLAGVAISLGNVFPLTGIAVLDGSISAFWIVTLVNAFNLIDVCDGLLAGLSALILFFWGHAHAEHALPALAMAGACGGFLVFNGPPASIFLGDSGSHFLGSALAVLTLSAAVHPGPWPRVPEALLLAGVPLFELAFLTLVRTRKGLKCWLGSPDHAALRLQAAGLTQLATDLVIWAAAALLLGIAAALVRVSLAGQIGLLLCAAASMLVWSRLLLRWEVSQR